MKTIQDGYLMSQIDIGEKLGLDQRTISKAEKSMLLKLKTGLSKHGITEQDFIQFMKYSGL